MGEDFGTVESPYEERFWKSGFGDEPVVDSPWGEEPGSIWGEL